MSDLKKIIKEEYDKKNAVITPKSLMNMINEALDAVYSSEVKEKNNKLNEMAVDKAREFVLSLPKFAPSEAWGDPNSIDRQQANRVFGVIGGGSTVSEKLKFLQRITAPDSKITSPRRIISSIIILECLSAVIKNFNAASAGFVFEGFMSALLRGTQEADIDPIGGNLPIQDLIAFSDKEEEGKAVPISLKLLNMTTGIHGSYTNLIDALNSFGRMVYIVARKSNADDNIAIEEFTFNRENFIDAILTTATGKMKKGKKGPKLFQLPDMTPEQSLVALKAADSWDEMYLMLQNTAGYNPSVRAKRQAAVKSTIDAEKNPNAEDEVLDDLRESIIKDWGSTKWGVLTEAKEQGGTQWEISAPALSTLGDVDYKKLGELPYGEEQIIAVARIHMDKLSSEILDLFTATQQLSENVNRYFLVPNRSTAIRSGDNAIENSVQIQNTLRSQIQSTDDDVDV